MRRCNETMKTLTSKKCPFKPASPEASCTDVQSSFLSKNACSHGQQFWEVAGVAPQWHRYILFQYVCSDIMQFVMVNGWVSSSGAGQCLCICEQLSTNTVWGKHWWRPTIPQAKGITVRSLMQGETIPIRRYHCEPAKCTLSCKFCQTQLCCW